MSIDFVRVILDYSYFSCVALREEQPDQVGLELLQGDEVHEEALLQ